MKTPVLGRGFAALLPTSMKRTVVQDVSLDSLLPSHVQPRRGFAVDALEQLAASIREKGILQPVLVRRTSRGLEIVAGERRCRAARLAGLTHVPAIISDGTEDGAALEIALIENIQREDLNPVEEAEAFRRLLGEYKLTHEETAKRVGKSRSAVSNALRLLELPDEVKRLLVSGEIGAGHARALLSMNDLQGLVAMARRIVEEKLSVRDVERVVQGRSHDRATDPARSAAASKPEPVARPEIRDLCERLQRALGTKVRVIERGPKEGRVEIDYFSPIDLDRIVERIMKRPS